MNDTMRMRGRIGADLNKKEMEKESKYAMSIHFTGLSVLLSSTNKNFKSDSPNSVTSTHEQRERIEIDMRKRHGEGARV